MWRLMSLLSLSIDGLLRNQARCSVAGKHHVLLIYFFKFCHVWSPLDFFFCFVFLKALNMLCFFHLSNMEYLLPLCFKFMLLFFSAQWWCRSLWPVLNNCGLTLVCVCVCVSPENGRMFEGCVFCQQAKWGWREMLWCLTCTEGASVIWMCSYVHFFTLYSANVHLCVSHWWTCLLHRCGAPSAPQCGPPVQGEDHCKYDGEHRFIIFCLSIEILTKLRLFQECFHHLSVILIPKRPLSSYWLLPSYKLKAFWLFSSDL